MKSHMQKFHDFPLIIFEPLRTTTQLIQDARSRFVSYEASVKRYLYHYIQYSQIVESVCGETLNIIHNITSRRLAIKMRLMQFSRPLRTHVVELD